MNMKVIRGHLVTRSIYQCISTHHLRIVQTSSKWCMCKISFIFPIYVGVVKSYNSCIPKQQNGSIRLSVATSYEQYERQHKLDIWYAQIDNIPIAQYLKRQHRIISMIKCVRWVILKCSNIKNVICRNQCKLILVKSSSYLTKSHHSVQIASHTF